MRELLDALRGLPEMKGAGVGNAQKEMGEFLLDIAKEISNDLEQAKVGILANPETLKPVLRPKWEVLAALAAFAVPWMKHSRSRDTYTGTRRAAALGILSEAGRFMDLPGGVLAAEEIAASGLSGAADATAFLSEYRSFRGEPEAPLQLLELKITLQGIAPAIWRRVRVPNDCTLGDLAYLLIEVMGWDGSHAHAFKFGTVYYGPGELVDSHPDTRHEDAFTLGSLLHRRGQTFGFDYDFGDNWRHQVRVEKVLAPDDNLPAPLCLAGGRACPPEDSGGIYGYLGLLEALEASRKHAAELPEHYEWLRDYDPEAFDLEAVNQKLRKMCGQTSGVGPRVSPL